MAKRSNRALRNLSSAGRSVAKFTGSTAGKAASGLIRWATTDHTNIDKALEILPSMKASDGVQFIFAYLLIILMGGVMMLVLVAFILPYLLFG